jgi:hypothetical protein
MDDYKIDETDVTSDNQYCASSDSDSSDKLSQSHEHDGSETRSHSESHILHQMEEFYDKNYENYEVYTEENVFQEKVWKIYFDDAYDLIYIFWAKIKQVKGSTLY